MVGFSRSYGRRLVYYGGDIERQGQANDQYQDGGRVSVYERNKDFEEAGFVYWRQPTPSYGDTMISMKMGSPNGIPCGS